MVNSRTLQNGTILNGKYMIESVIGEGGFGITYKATDLTLEEIVAIKEYFPSSLATRDTISGKTDEVTVITGDSETAFKRGVKKFEDEAARLAKFQKEPGIVSVKTFFHENNTGYMVMEYIDGITLKEYLENHGGKVSPDEAKKIMGRVFTSLSNVHKAGIVHRDISPDNIMITSNGQGKLIDFGAARFVGNEDEKSLTVILKEGYAPPEQYHSDGKQGPWTDIYAICATMYRMVSGNRPQEASGRMMNGDEVVPLSKCAGADPVFSRTIEKGMSIEVRKRYQTVEKLISAFDGKRIPRKYYVIAGAASALVLIGLIILVINLVGAKKDNAERVAINKKQSKEGAEAKNENGEDSGENEAINELQDTVHEEYIAFKEYFYNNYMVSDGQDSYVYFYDIQHKGIDNMIVVQPIYESYDSLVGDYFSHYEIYVCGYENSEVSQIYDVSVGSPDGYEIYANGGNAQYTDCVFIVPIEELFYIGEVSVELNNSVPYFRYSIFSLDGEGNEIVLYEDNGKSNDHRDKMTDLFEESIRLNSMNLRMIYDSQSEGGIDMAYIHDYRRVFSGDGYSKEYDAWIWENYLSEYGKLKDLVFIDLDKSGSETIIALYETPENIDDDDPYMGDGYRVTVVAFYDDSETILENYRREEYEYPPGISVLQFGKTRGLLCGSGYSPQAIGQPHRKLFIKDEGEFITFMDYSGGDYDYENSSGDNNIEVSGDYEGYVYINVWGEVGYGMDLWKDSHFYVGYLNGEFFEYDSIPIDITQLECFENYQDVLEETKQYVESHGDYGMNGDVIELNTEISDILYSSNDMIYVNYKVTTKEADYFGSIADCIYLYSAVLKICGDSLEFVDYEYARRLPTSGVDLKSYTKEFSY